LPFFDLEEVTPFVNYSQLIYKGMKTKQYNTLKTSYTKVPI